MNNLLTLDQAAETLNISLSKLRRLLREGKIKAVVISSRGDKRIDPKDLEDFIEGSKK